MDGGLRCLLFDKGVHLFRAVDLDVGDEGDGVGEVEVFAGWGGVVGHGFGGEVGGF